MQMVAAAKMRRAQEQVLATRPYSEKAWDLLTHLASQRAAGEPLHPLLQTRPVNTTGLLLVTGDRGLCGGYNHNIIRATLEYIEQSSVPVKLVVVGRKGCDYAVRAGLEPLAHFMNLPTRPAITDITPISHILIQEFLNGTLDKIVMAYTDFVNTLVQVPIIRPLLPIRHTEMPPEREEPGSRASESAAVEAVEFIYEPDPRTILDTVVPRFTEIQVYQAILEAIASEHSARMVAMRNATDNAQGLIEDLTLSYNRARQASITSEMLDIATGAEALSKAREV